MSLVVSGLVAMSVRMRLYELPAARAILHVRIVGGERRAVVPIRSGRSHDRRGHHRRVVVARPIAWPVIEGTRADEKSAADEDTRATTVKVWPPKVRRRRPAAASESAPATGRARILRGGSGHDDATGDGEP